MSVSARSAGALALAACLTVEDPAAGPRGRICHARHGVRLVDGFAMPGTECGWVGVLCAGGTTVETLSLFWNDLSGSIPSELANLTNLVNLYLDENALSGAIPLELRSLANLQTLYLNENQLSGGIPPELGGLVDLTRLYLSGNRLAGPIPPALGDMLGLLRLRLDGNTLSGPAPAALMNLTALENGEDAASSFCGNRLYTDDDALSAFLDSVQIGGDWQGCQAAQIPLVPEHGLVAVFLLMAGAALWALGRATRGEARTAPGPT